MNIRALNPFIKIYCIANFVLILTLVLPSCKSEVKSIPSIIELVDTDSTVTNEKILQFCVANQIEKKSVFNWQNHWIFYTDQSSLETLDYKIRTEFQKEVINVYPEPFYNFNRKVFCKKEPAEKWQHIIMTANLVDNPVLQHEYMRYHEIQFNEWKEVPQGFCNADFQQVLVFKHDRQLMLVISFPEGKTLDELNPKTEENNPRVKEWNSIMSRFQVRIEDAPEGSTWVIFSEIQ